MMILFLTSQGIAMNKSLIVSLALTPLIVSVAAVSFFSLQVVGHAAPFNLDRASFANVSLMEADTVLGTFRPLQIRGTYPNTVVAATLAEDNGNGNGEKDGDKDEADDNDQEKGKDEGGGWDRLWDSPTLG
jgi:hypothetical protein